MFEILYCTTVCVPPQGYHSTARLTVGVYNPMWHQSVAYEIKQTFGDGMEPYCTDSRVQNECMSYCTDSRVQNECMYDLCVCLILPVSIIA